MATLGEEFAGVLIAAARRVGDGLFTSEAVVAAAATRLAAGGGLFVASNAPGFVSDVIGKGAGLMMMRAYPNARPAVTDVVVVSWCSESASPPDSVGSCELDTAEMLADLRSTGALLVTIGPALPGGDAPSMDTHCPKNALTPRLSRAFGGATFPVTSLTNVLCQWSFTAELLSALARGGRMLAVYQSVLTPGGRERNALRAERWAAGNPWEPDWHGVAPARGELAAEYLGATVAILEGLDWQNIAAATEHCGAALKEGRRVVAYMIGHFPVWQWGMPGDHSGIERLEGGRHGQMPDTDEVAAKVCPIDYLLWNYQRIAPSKLACASQMSEGDVLLHLGYYSRPAEAYTAARAKGASVVEILAAGPGRDIVTNIDGSVSGAVSPGDIAFSIDPLWPWGDGLVAVDGLDVEVLPSSGYGQAAMWWMIAAGLVDGATNHPRL